MQAALADLKSTNEYNTASTKNIIKGFSYLKVVSVKIFSLNIYFIFYENIFSLCLKILKHF